MTAEKQTPSPEQKKTETPLADLGEELSDDWESAFQAEDYMFQADQETMADFFVQKEGTKPDQGGKEASHAEDSIKNSDISPIPLPSFLRTPLIPSLLHKVKNLYVFPLQFIPGKLQDLLHFIPKHLKPFLFWVPATLLIAIPVLHFSTQSQTTQEVREESVASVPPLELDQEKADKEAPEIIEAPPEKPTMSLPEQPLLHQKPPIEAVEKDLNVSPVPSVPTKKVKWPLNPFYFAVSSDSAGSEPVFVEVELTLLTLLHKDKLLPEGKNIFIRDIIYKFYMTQSLEELNRYTFSRGSMKNNLHDWIRDKWPESPIYGILFNKYHVL